MSIDSAPELVRKMGARRWVSGLYEGAGEVQAHVYELKSEASGLELAQRWRPAANTVFFYTPHYFAVVTWESNDRAAVTALVRALEKRLQSE